MTLPRYVAESLKVLSNPNVVAILNREIDITPVINAVQSWWGYDLFARKPSPAYDDYGIFQGTDLDLACFLYSLSGRGAIINIPTYKTHSKKKQRTDQKLTSTENRHGELIGVQANKEFFSFSIKMIDQNVIGEDKVGDYRTFSLTDKTGEWYDGWRKIEFVPTLKENRFITENRLWGGNQITFKNFIHPNRWTSFFGHHFVITKMLMDRLTDESAYLNREVKAMIAEGIKFPTGQGPSSYGYDYGDSKQVKFNAFECMIYIPESKTTGNYPEVEHNQKNLIECYDKRKLYTYSVIPALRFMTRASEYAHYTNPERFPAWIKNVKWESDFVIPKKKKKWDRLKLFQDAVGEFSVSILKRSYQKSATVGDD